MGIFWTPIKHAIDVLERGMFACQNVTGGGGVGGRVEREKAGEEGGEGAGHDAMKADVCV